MTHTLPLLTSPAEVLERYETALANDQLKQAAWHDTAKDGRWLACAIGVIGSEVDSPDDCPASIMPRWLARMVPAFFDRQRAEDAKAWGLEFYKALTRLGGNVPFSVVHDWHANTVCQLGIDVAEKRDCDPAPHKALQALHLRVLAGEKIAADEWLPVLKDVDAFAYAHAFAFAYVDADVDAFAYADAFADAYADAWKLLADGMVAALNRVEVAA